MTVTPTTESGYAIVIDGDLGPFDAAHSYALALGAAFDHDFLTDDDRSRFSAAIGATGRPWLSQRYADSPAAAFAHAFARLSCNGPWRDDAWRGAYWTPEAEGHVLYTCRAVIQEADNRRSGTLAI